MVNAWKFFKRLKCSSNSCCRPYDRFRGDHVQNIKLPNGDSISIHGYEPSYIKSFLMVVWTVLTFLVGLILASTRPGGLSPWLYRRSSLARASKVIVNKDVKLSQIERDNEGRRWFTWQQHRFTWCEQSIRFKRVRTVDEIGLRLNDIHGLGSGLDFSNHQLRKENYGDGGTEIPRPNLVWTLAESVLKPFRIYQVAAITVWCFNEYYVYASLIGLLVVIEIIWKVVLKHKYRVRLHESSLLCGQKEVTILSPGQEKRRIPSTELVPGCVMELSLYNGDNLVLMPCDAVILSGSCLVYENGSSKPIHKYQLPRSRTEVYHIKTHRNHTLFRNSKVMMTNLENVTALVLRTGWSTEHGAVLAAKVQEEDYGTPTTFERHLDHLFLGLFLIGIGVSLYAICSKIAMGLSLDALSFIIPPALDFISLCLPPLLPAALFITTGYPLIRLYMNGFRFQSSADPSVVVNRIGATDTVCILENALLNESEMNLLSIASTKFPEWTNDPRLSLCLGACHSLTIRNGRLTGDPGELKLFPFSKWRISAEETGHFNLLSSSVAKEVYRITRIYARGNLTLVRLDPIDSSPSWYFIKGHYDAVMQFAEDFTSDRSIHQSKHVLAFAGRPLSDSEKLSNREPDLSLLSGKFQLLGVAVLESKASPESRGIVRELRAAGIRNVLISRQGAEEAVHLARNAGLIISKEPVARIEIPSTEERAPPSLTVVDLPLPSPADSGQTLHPHSGMDNHQDACHLFVGGDEEEEGLVIQRHAHVVLLGDTLDLLIQSFPEMVDQIVGRVTVLASADVHQTDRFLHRLQNIRRNILICKAAEDYSPISPVACLTLTPDEDGLKRLQRGQVTSNSRSMSCVGELLKQCRSSLIGSVGISKIMICYAIARLTSALLLYVSSSPSSGPEPAVQSAFIDMALVMIPAFLYGWTRPNNGSLPSSIPAKSLLQVREIVSLVIQLILIIAGQGFALVMAQHQPWFQAGQNTLMDSVSTDENYAVYSLSLFQYLTIFLVFSAGPPHRRRIWTNIALSLCLIALTLFCSVLILRPPPGLQSAMSLKLPPVFDFRLAIFSLAAVYLFTSIGIQALLDHCLSFSNPCRSRLNIKTRESSTSQDNLSNINVLYRPISLTIQPSERIDSPSSTYSLPIF